MTWTTIVVWLGAALLVTTTEGLEKRCALPVDHGECNNNVVLFFFNATSKECEPFTYGGCYGNANRFGSKFKCLIACDSVTRTDCLQPKDPGPCNSHKARYYYNTLNGKCELFIYGGCQGNKNNFDNKSQCQTTCYGLVPPPCSPALNNCREETPRSGDLLQLVIGRRMCLFGFICFPGVLFGK